METADNEESRIHGKVAAILGTRELILNCGAVHGVQIGMRFAILSRNSAEIKDPDSGEVLGAVEVPKTIVKIVRLQGDKLSVGRTFRTVKGALAGITMGDRTEILEFKRGADRGVELDPQDSFVKVGDTAVQTRGDEYDDLSE